MRRIAIEVQFSDAVSRIRDCGLTGDDVAWAAPGFDDSMWESRVVPDDWNQTAESRYDGFAWYRFASVTLRDDQTEVVREAQGRIVMDTIRSWIGHRADGTTAVIYPPAAAR
jgi:hypothetical protein